MVNRWSRGSVVSPLTLIPGEAQGRETHNRQCLVSSTPTQEPPGQHQCTNARISLENRHFSATFGDARRSFQVAIQAQHVVAASCDRT